MSTPLVGGRQTSARRRKEPEFSNGTRVLISNVNPIRDPKAGYVYKGGDRETVRVRWGYNWIDVPLLTLAEADDLNFVIEKRWKQLMRISYQPWRRLGLKPCAAVRSGPGESYAYPLYPTHLPVPAEIY